MSKEGVRFAIGKQKGYDEKGKPWYDTKRGIKGALASLNDFMELVSERHKAGYDRGERMNEFYVLGRYWMDTCGNCGKISGWIPKEQVPDLPGVMTREEFWDYVKENIPDADKVCISSGANSELPYDGVICPVCEKGWTIQNCHDTVPVHKTEVYPLADFIGKTLSDVKEHLAKKTDALYRMQDDIMIRNDRFIDLSPKYPNPKADWEKGIVKNEQGWVSARDGIDDGYIIKGGDEGYFNVWTYYHGECNRLHLARREEMKFREIFESAGYRYVILHQIPNKYCPCRVCAPWFRVDTELGTFEIGWRKRVININWSNVSSDGRNLISLFRKEDVTKGSDYIHAWSWEKAQEYLSKIREALTA